MNALRKLAPAPAGAALHRVRRFVVGALLLGGAVAWAQPVTLPAVVVWDFDDQTPPGLVDAGSTGFLKRSLSENLTSTLLQVAGLPVVERQRLKDLLAEQKLAASALADDDARLRLGKIVGAQRMVFGGFFVLGDEVQVHVRVVDTASSRVVFSDEATAAVPAVMQKVAPMNRRLAQALGGGSAASGRSHAPEIWQAYDRALAQADAGDYEAAIPALQALLARAPDFTPAERQLVALLDRAARR